MGTKSSVPHFNFYITDLLENGGLNGQEEHKSSESFGFPPPCPALGPVRALQRDATSPPSVRNCGFTSLLLFEGMPQKDREQKINSFPSKNRTAVERSLSGEALQVSVF